MTRSKRIGWFPNWYMVEDFYQRATHLQRLVADEFSDPKGVGPNIREQEARLGRELELAYNNFVRSKFPRLSGANYRLVKACANYTEEFCIIPRMANRP